MSNKKSYVLLNRFLQLVQMPLRRRKNLNWFRRHIGKRVYLFNRSSEKHFWATNGKIIADDIEARFMHKLQYSDGDRFTSLKIIQL